MPIKIALLWLPSQLVSTGIYYCRNRGTARALRNGGVPCEIVNKVTEGVRILSI